MSESFVVVDGGGPATPDRGAPLSKDQWEALFDSDGTFAIFRCCSLSGGR